MVEPRIDLTDFNRDMEHLQSSHERGITRGLDRVATIGLQAKRTQVGKTYARKIPTGKSGPKWQRSGDWMGEQRIETPHPHERHVVTVGNAEKYESVMAHRNTGADGINRSNNATENAAAIIPNQVQAAFDAEYSAVQRVD